VNRHQLEKIREERTLLAYRKNLMGPGGKLGAIVKTLGQPIMAETGVDTNWMEDPYALYDPEDIPEFMEDPNAIPIGFVWDGLREGIHMEIKIDNFKNKISCHYQGYLVYQEEENVLHAYAPRHPMAGEWEHIIDDLYARAKRIKLHDVKVEEKIAKQGNKGLARKILDALRMRWGD